VWVSAVRCEGYAVTWTDDFPAYRRFHTHDGAGNRVEVLGELP